MDECGLRIGILLHVELEEIGSNQSQDWTKDLVLGLKGLASISLWARGPQLPHLRNGMKPSFQCCQEGPGNNEGRGTCRLQVRCTLEVGFLHTRRNGGHTKGASGLSSSQHPGADENTLTQVPTHRYGHLRPRAHTQVYTPLTHPYVCPCGQAHSYTPSHTHLCFVTPTPSHAHIYTIKYTQPLCVSLQRLSHTHTHTHTHSHRGFLTHTILHLLYTFSHTCT